MNDESAWESAMSRDFDARVRNLHESPLSLDDVRGKAGSIRRRRRAAAAGGVLAAAAIVVPGALLAALPGNDDAGPEPAEDPTVVTEDEVAYLAGTTWHRADGSEVELPAGKQYIGAVVWDGKLVVETLCCEGERTEINVIDGDGEVEDTFFSNGSVAVNESGATMAWMNEDFDIQTRSASGDHIIDGGPRAEGYGVLGLVGGPDCDPAADGCTVYTSYLTYDSDGTTSPPPGEGPAGPNDAGAHGLTRTESVTDDSSCGGFFDPSGTRLWATCDHTLRDIAPGGGYVQGMDPYLDGIGQSFAAILDADTGEEVARYETGREQVLLDPDWADDSHLLMPVYDYSTQAHQLLLLAADGTVTEVTDPVPGEDMDNPFTPIRR